MHLNKELFILLLICFLSKARPIFWGYAANYVPKQCKKKAVTVFCGGSTFPIQLLQLTNPIGNIFISFALIACVFFVIPKIGATKKHMINCVCACVHMYECMCACMRAAIGIVAGDFAAYICMYILTHMHIYAYRCIYIELTSNLRKSAASLGGSGSLEGIFDVLLRCFFFSC